VIGEFSGTGRLELFFHDAQVADLDMEFLHEGIPSITKEAHWTPAKIKEPKVSCPKDLTEPLLEALSHYNVCSKETVIRQYDHEVQGASVIKPLVGLNSDGPSDATVITPKLGSKKGVAISNGINFRYGMIDPFWMAASCIDEAIRQIIAVGGNLERIAILDNFCWGNPDKPDRLGSLVQAAQGCYKIAVGYGVPFISGKDSLYNEYTENKKSIAIPGTVLISAIGIVEDVTKCVTMDFKKSGNLIYVIGATKNELGGSIYYDNLGVLGNTVPKVDFKSGTRTFTAVNRAVKGGLVASLHDCSEGGIAVALAEMAFAGGLGVSARLDRVPYVGKDKRNDFILFSESNARFIAEVKPANQKKFENLMKGLPVGLIGRVEETPEFVIYGTDQKACVNTYIEELKEAWQRPLR
jgi:phosphoribosylformylglycinamidine synthase